MDIATLSPKQVPIDILSWKRYLLDIQTMTPQGMMARNIWKLPDEFDAERMLLVPCELETWLQ